MKLAYHREIVYGSVSSSVARHYQCMVTLTMQKLSIQTEQKAHLG